MKTQIEQNNTLIENGKTIIENNKTNIESPFINQNNFRLLNFKGFKVIKEFPTKGAEADLYLVEKNGKKFILKLYRKGIAPKEELVEKVLELSQQYPNDLVQIYKIYRDIETQKWYEIQEYIKYGSLRDLITKVPYQKQKSILKLIIQEISSILKTLHINNIIHRDLKPENILIRSIKPFDLVITDFGISSILQDEFSHILTSKSGTYKYFAPESFSKYIGKEVDYWAFGIIILEILLQKHPFDGIEENIIIYELSTKGIEVPSTIDKEYQLLLKGLLTRDPKKRWSFKEIEEWLSGKKDIDVWYEYQKEIKSIKGYRFNNKEFFDLENLLKYMYQDKKYFEAKEHILRGYIVKWLEDIGMFDEAITIDKLIKRTPNPDINIFLIYNHYIKPKEFVFMSKIININNLLFFTQQLLINKDNSKLVIEKSIIKYITNKELQKAYKLASIEDEDLEFLFKRSEKLSDSQLYFLLKIIKKKKLAYEFVSCNFYKNYENIYYLLDSNQYLIPDELIEKIKNQEKIHLETQNFISLKEFEEFNEIRANYNLLPLSKEVIITNVSLYRKTLNEIREGFTKYEKILEIDNRIKEIKNSNFYSYIENKEKLKDEINSINRWEEGEISLSSISLEEIEDNLKKIEDELENLYKKRENKINNINKKLETIESSKFYKKVKNKKILHYSGLEEFFITWEKSKSFSFSVLNEIDNDLSFIIKEIKSIKEGREELRRRTVLFIIGSIIGGSLGALSGILAGIIFSAIIVGLIGVFIPEILEIIELVFEGIAKLIFIIGYGIVGILQGALFLGFIGMWLSGNSRNFGMGAAIVGAIIGGFLRIRAGLEELNKQEKSKKELESFRDIRDIMKKD